MCLWKEILKEEKFSKTKKESRKNALRTFWCSAKAAKQSKTTKPTSWVKWASCKTLNGLSAANVKFSEPSFDILEFVTICCRREPDLSLADEFSAIVRRVDESRVGDNLIVLFDERNLNNFRSRHCKWRNKKRIDKPIRCCFHYSLFSLIFKQIQT